MATTFQKNVKRIFTGETNVHPDRVIVKKDGSVELLSGYFYRHGRSDEKWGATVAAELTRNGVENFDIRTEDRWAAWPKDSYFAAIVTEKAS